MKYLSNKSAKATTVAAGATALFMVLGGASDCDTKTVGKTSAQTSAAPTGTVHSKDKICHTKTSTCEYYLYVGRKGAAAFTPRKVSRQSYARCGIGDVYPACMN